ncbi:MAG: DEAD/DEAH box helicase family protein, partial [Spirochaetes bacterium]|nr:DEAD/DEAH box helicase family protein [Spirochaetota bacterium]
MDIMPRDFGLEHNEWRKGQKEAIILATEQCNKEGGFLFLELPTGVGKTAIPTALSKNNNVLALVQTLSLLDQYEKEYKFDIVKGRQEYPCVLKEKVVSWRLNYNKEPTAADCHFSDPRDCMQSSNCPYIIAKDKAARSTRAACTYKYASLSDVMRDRKGVLVLDEAHLAGHELLSLAEFFITSEQIKEFNLPDFPFYYYGAGGSGDMIDMKTRARVVIWMNDCIKTIGNITVFDRMTEKGSKVARMLQYITCALDMVQDEKIDLFMKCGKIEQMNTAGLFGNVDYGSKKRMYISIKPLYVSRIAWRLFGKKDTTILMSATIGNPDPLAKELGISDYRFETFDHPIPKVKRPVFDLGCPKMTYKNISDAPGIQNAQATLIYNFIKGLPKKWRGIILTSSYQKVETLKSLLKERLNGRIIIGSANGKSVTSRVDEFIDSDMEGAIAIDTIQGWGTGLDFRGDKARFVIVAGIQQPNPRDKFDMARISRAGGRKYAQWTTYNSV